MNILHHSPCTHIVVSLQQCLIKDLSSVVEVFYICPVQYSSHWTDVAVEPLNCDYCD